MYFYKMYFEDRYEIIFCAPYGTHSGEIMRAYDMFLENLLTFLEMDCSEVVPIFQRISVNWDRWLLEGSQDAATAAMDELAQVSRRHVFFRLPYVRWYDRYTHQTAYNDRGSIEDTQMADELRQLPEQLPLYQRKVQRFFDLVLDVDKAGRDPQQQIRRYFSCDAPNHPKDPEMFSFTPIPISLEPIDTGDCVSVLYAKHISDIIDFSLRTCVERNVTVRRCKKCGRYFAQTGRVSAEYCDRLPIDGYLKCRAMGSYQQWAEKQSDDPVFRAYRREYKRRFAWIKAGRITANYFYAWSERAREQKKKCDRDIISLEEFEKWLKES